MSDYIIDGLLKVANFQPQTSEKRKPEFQQIQKVIDRWNSRKTYNSSAVIAESILDNLFGKKAQNSMSDEACKLLSLYVAFTRALYLLHQQNHWEALSYGDHLLFQRLYEDAQEIADDTAERVMGLCGKIDFNGKESDIVQKFLPKDKSFQGLVQSSLAIEKAFQVLCKKVYDFLKEKEMITLGLDDLIMGQASDGEVHLYLLQQALKGYSK